MFYYYMKIFYGLSNNNIDVTEICFTKLMNNGIIRIPPDDDLRANIFTDPMVRVLKKVIIENNNVVTEYEYFHRIQINTLDNTVTVENENELNEKLAQIHSKLQIRYGSFHEELPEQKMTLRYLTGNENVLEIGGNIGRNSILIAHILKSKNNNNLVTLEPDTNIANKLRENMNINNFEFHIENAALSKRKLIQRGWETYVSDTLLNGFQPVNTISLVELRAKYNIAFDTLVLDCEGAFYYIVMDMPEILDNINLIIVENDYRDISKKEYVDKILKQNDFYVDYVEPGGWEPRQYNLPCLDNFFEVWKRKLAENKIPSF